MTIDTPEKDSFLQELHRTSGGEARTHVSMYKLGESLGLTRSEASALSEDLIIDGYVELQNLSGAISITQEGLAAIGITAEVSPPQNLPQLSGEKIITDNDSQLLNRAIDKVRKCTFNTDTDLAQLEELLIDLKTLEIQLLSSRPKTTVVHAILTSIKEEIRQHAASDALSNLEAELESLVNLNN
ncbi:hypothetical protein [Desulfosediminicola ganghwensis]|uniref:hypothetical protein n=1 Tax=Desulfosediminicola ganghwensis TaxID=2569540 RepID=UPI0010AC1A64|nr:hypothetical protein [Desulfosediminicola ganghwensis]